MSNSVDPDEMAHMSRLIWIYAVCKKPIIIACGSESQRITLLFEFIYYIENLLNFSIPLSYISM